MWICYPVRRVEFHFKLEKKSLDFLAWKLCAGKIARLLRVDSDRVQVNVPVDCYTSRWSTLDSLVNFDWRYSPDHPEYRIDSLSEKNKIIQTRKRDIPLSEWNCAWRNLQSTLHAIPKVKPQDKGRSILVSLRANFSRASKYLGLIHGVKALVLPLVSNIGKYIIFRWNFYDLRIIMSLLICHAPLQSPLIEAPTRESKCSVDFPELTRSAILRARLRLARY